MENLFARIALDLLRLFFDSFFVRNLNCFYCLEPVYIWYEIAREPKQWTVERIDNKFGHNIGNIEIACLSCNLKRRCMYHERYIFTKQIKIVKNEKQT